MMWRYAGFRYLTGLDTYFSKPMTHENGVRFVTRWEDLRDQEFEFIMLNHSLEHMPDQFDAMGEVNRCLKLNHHALVRVPCCNSEAWQRYGVNWHGLDPPRHFFIHSLESLRIVAERTGFEIIATEWDSGAWQFFLSEQYARDISRMDERSYMRDAEHSVFSPSEIAEWERQSKTANAMGRGDQVVLHLRKVRDFRRA
jgi:Methyltransferase domain